MNTRIAEVRKNLGLTQEKFAKQIGVTRNFLWMIENNNRTPSKRIIKAICREFNVSENWLCTGQGQIFTSGHGEHFKNCFLELLDNLTPAEWETLGKITEQFIEIKNRKERKDLP